MDSYIYFHYTADTNEIFYVGQGVRSRAWHTQNRSRYWKNVAKKHGFYAVVIKAGLTKEDANTWERWWIQTLGRRDLEEGMLVNLTDGGEGPLRPSEERLCQLREYSTGVTFTTERKTKISQKLKQHCAKPETREKRRQQNYKMWSDPAFRAKTSAAMRKPKTKHACTYCGKEMSNGHLAQHGHTVGRCVKTSPEGLDRNAPNLPES